MKVAIVILTVGDTYITTFNNYFRDSVEKYCHKYNYDLFILTELLKPEENINRKQFFWQRLLIPDKYSDYDYVITMDSDIYVSENAPELPLKDIPEGKVGASNERKYLGYYEWREMIQLNKGWEKTGRDWHKLSGETRDYDDHINGGLVIYQPKYHAKIIKKLYDDNISNYQKYHQDDQSILSLFLIDNDLIFWIDQRFNRIWFFWKELMYPHFNAYDENMKKIFIKNFINLNYFSHFTSYTDVQYLK